MLSTCLDGWAGVTRNPKEAPPGWGGEEGPRAGHGGFEEHPVMPRALCPHACPPIGRDPFIKNNITHGAISEPHFPGMEPLAVNQEVVGK